MNNKRLYYALFVIFLFFLFLCFFLFYFPQKESREFKALSNELFFEELSKDSLSLHYTLSNPSDFGFDTSKAVFPCFAESDYSDSKVLLDTYQTKLSKINPKQLKKDDTAAYQSLLSYLNMQKESLNFPYYGEPLSPNSGLQSQLPILLAEYSFYQKEDVEHYLSLLSQIPSYFESMVLYEGKKANAGLFMSTASADSVIAQCDLILTKESLENNSHFLIKTFDERLSKLIKTGLLTKEEANTFYQKNKEVLSDVVYPAYVSLGDELYLLRDSGKNDMGLFYFPKGKEYYSYLVKSTTGSGKSIDELKRMLLHNLESEQENITACTQSISQLLPQCGNQLPLSLPIEEPIEMMKDLKVRMEHDYPSFPINDVIVSCELKTVDECLEDYVSPAFYMTPPIDNVLNNVIYLNEKEPLEAIDCYTTLAHEGYPGHLYQSVYHILSQQKEKRAPLESILYYGGYTEGWAFYVENNAYEYAKEMLPDTKEKELVCEYFELCRLRRNQQLMLFSLLDIAIHSDGMTFEEAQKILAEFGIKDISSAQNIYRYIVDEPANYLKYCIGYLEILECRDLAMKYWKQEYSPLRFHTFFLECGPVSFPFLQREIKSSTYSQFVSAAILL